MTSMATVREDWYGDVPIARLEGEIDASNVNDLGARLRTLVTNRSTGLIVDLSGVTYLDSAGINLLFALGDELSRRQQVLRLVVAGSSPTARMLDVTSLAQVHATYPTLAEALAQA